jgi:hypothetical protein
MHFASLRGSVLAGVLLAIQMVTSSAAAAEPGHARGAVLAATPPMGWNSWDAYGLTITEDQFRENVRVLDDTLKPFGWTYAVIDEGWFLKNPQDRPTPEKLIYVLDDNGRYIPDPVRFPSALTAGRNTGFAALAKDVHARGLKFGIHIVRGIPRESVARNLPVAHSRFRAQDVADQTDACPWDPTNWGVKDTPAGQAWYDSLIAQYAAWGVDYLKVDCISDHPFKLAEIRMIHKAIVRSGRPIILSLSPGPTSPGVLSAISPYAQLWRISDDVWDDWSNPEAWPQGLKGHFDLLSGWGPVATAGSWPDADMLPIGYLGPNPGYGEARQSQLTPVETQTMLSLWAMARSPLILGANLTRLDADTTRLLTNKDLIALDQSSYGQHQEAREGFTVVWSSRGRDGARYLAFFNLGDQPVHVQHSLGFYNLPQSSYEAKTVVEGERLGRLTSIDITLPAHGSRILKLTPSS